MLNDKHTLNDYYDLFIQQSVLTTLTNVDAGRYIGSSHVIVP